MQLADARVSERPLFSERDRWFESAFLQQRVQCEPDSGPCDAHVILTVSRFEVARAFYRRLLPEFGTCCPTAVSTRSARRFSIDGPPPVFATASVSRSSCEHRPRRLRHC